MGRAFRYSLTEAVVEQGLDFSSDGYQIGCSSSCVVRVPLGEFAQHEKAHQAAARCFCSADGVSFGARFERAGHR